MRVVGPTLFPRTWVESADARGDDGMSGLGAPVLRRLLIACADDAGWVAALPMDVRGRFKATFTRADGEVLHLVIAVRSITRDTREAGVWTPRLKVQRTSLQGVADVDALLGFVQFGEQTIVLAFPVGRYLPAKGESDPIYFPEDLVLRARTAAGFLSHSDQHGEIAAAFQGPLLMDYLSGAAPNDIETDSTLSVDRVMSWRRPRSRAFVDAVMSAYGGRCGACGMHMELAEAAHIHPHRISADDSPANGIALCPNHHTAFDLGNLIAFRPDRRVLVHQDRLAHLRWTGTAHGADMLVGSLMPNLLPVHLDQASYLRKRFEMNPDRVGWEGVA